MLPRIAVANQLPGPRIEVGLGVLHRLGKRLRGWAVQDAHAAAWAFRNFDPIQPGAFVLPSGADRPDLPWRQGVAPDMVFALQFRGDDELLHPVVAHRVAEVGVAELGSPDRFCCSLTRRRDSSASRTAHSKSSSEIGTSGSGIEQLQQSADGLVHGRRVAAAEGTAEHDPALERR